MSTSRSIYLAKGMRPIIGFCHVMPATQIEWRTPPPEAVGGRGGSATGLRHQIARDNLVGGLGQARFICAVRLGDGRQEAHGDAREEPR